MSRPCPWCGYFLEACAGAVCSACGERPLEPSLRERAGTWRGVKHGLAAPFRGLHLLATTRGTKRWLVPPVLLSLAAFAALFAWLWGLARSGLAALRSGAPARPDSDASWPVRAARWWLDHTALAELAELTGFVLAAAVALLAMLWTFSFVYELVAGPFLDEIHGRVERRWFGRDPREERERPSGIEPAECARVTLLAALAGAACVALACFASGWSAALLGLGGPLASFAVAAWADAPYRRWLAWRLAVEARTLATSLEAAALSALLLALALPLLFVPLAGYPLFALAAGFTTAIGLLDVPLSRRRWGLRLRLAFLLQHFPSVLAFGSAAGVVFLVPVLGPLALVPAASVGGLWLVCKLDKSALR